MSMPTTIHSIGRLYHVNTLVASLFFIGRPPTISWLVVPIYVDSFNRCLVLAVSSLMVKERHIHVISEALKRRPEKLYASAAVIFVSWVVRVCTSVPYSLVSMIKTVLCCANRSFLVSSKHVFAEYMATGFTISPPKVRRRNDSSSSAFTLAQKLIVSTFIKSLFLNNRKFTERLTNQINAFHIVLNAKALDALRVSSAPAVRLLIV